MSNASKYDFWDRNSFPTILTGLLRGSHTTQQQLAEAIGCSRQTVSLYANGNASPDAEKLKLIADFFHVSTDYLLGRTNTKTQNADLRAICDYTGLSEAAVSELHNSKELINDCNDKRAIIVESMTEYAHSCEAAFDIVNLFIKGHMFQMGRHLYKYKLGIAEAVEEHSANIKGFGSLEARIKANEEAPRYRKRLPFVTVAPEYWEKRDNNKKEQLAKYELYEAADDFKSLLKELASEEERALREIKAEYKKLEEAEEAALIGEKNSDEEAKDSENNGNDN